jgi:predicted nucleic acid-binding protein
MQTCSLHLAHNPSGKAALIIDLGVQGNWGIVSCSYATEEVRRNISIKFPDYLERFETLISGIKKVPSRSGRNCPAPLPEKDRPILEAATHCKAAHLLTGDIKDFGTVMNNASLTGGVVIQTASEFLEGFLESRSKK